MTRATLVAIFKQAIMDMAFKEGIQVNTFYHLDRMPDFNNQALGATMDLYHEGRFWSRDWANSGASPDEICAQWPIAVLEDQDIEDGRGQSSTNTGLHPSRAVATLRSPRGFQCL